MKDRALGELDYAPGHVGISNAIASVASDMTKHPDTRGHPAAIQMTALALTGQLQTAADVRAFIVREIH